MTLQGPSDDELAELVSINAHMKALDDLWERKSETCPTCGKHVTSMAQVGRCCYCRPCGCRAGQGRLHANWKGTK